MNHSQSSMLQSLKQQQSGFSDMQQLQQQLTLRKMQELQRQQQLRQLDARQQDAVNLFSPFAKQGMGNYPSSLINGTAVSDSLNNPWGNELVNVNWLQRASPPMQGSSNGLVYSNHGQGQLLMGLVPQQGDQSLYGVPVSGLRGNVNQFSQLAAEKPSMQQMETFGNSVPGNQYMAFAEQASIQDGPLITRQRFPGDNFFSRASSQAPSPVMNLENLQQVNPVKRNAPLQEIQGRTELAAQQDKTLTQVATSQNGVALDPTEERILFGSDDNIFSSFGKSSDMNGDACGQFDGGGLNGIPSLQSGTWSALMQSAVAETSGSDIGPQDEWSSLNFQSPVVPSGNDHPAYSEKQQASFSNDLTGSSLNSSVLASNNRNTNNNYQNVMESQQRRNNFACESGDGLQANSSERYANPSEEGSTWSNAGLLQNAVAEVSPIYGKASLSRDAETNVNSSPSGHWPPVQTGFRQQCSRPNGWNILPSVACSGDASVSMHESENSSQHSQDSEQKRVMHAKVVPGSSLWNSNSIPSSTVEGRLAKSPAGIFQVNSDGFSVSSAPGMPTSSITGVNEESSKFPSNSYLNYWQNVNPAVKSQGGKNVVMSHHHVNEDNQAMESSLNSRDREEVIKSEIETCNKNDNSSFNHPSNISRCNSAGGLKENPLTDIGDSRFLHYGKQKSVNQIGLENSGPRKFQFHPMGNLDEDVEPSNGMGQHSHLVAMTQQSSHSVPSKVFGQVTESSAELAKGQSVDQKDAKGIGDTPTSANASIPFNQSVDMFMPSKDSHSSNQNMLELLHKVDQSREHGSVTHYSSSECNLSSEMPEAENSDCSVDRLQWGLSSASQGFGLQLGPPHRIAMPNQSFSSQSSLQTVNSVHQSQSTPGTAEKGQSRFNVASSIQYLSSSEKQELKDNRSGLSRKAGDDAFVHKTPGAFISDVPHLRSELHHRQPNQPDVSHSVEKDGSLSRPAGQNLESSLPDAARNVRNYNSGPFRGTSEQSSSNHPHARSSIPHVLSRGLELVSQPSSASGLAQQEVPANVFPKMWHNVPGNPHLMGTEFPKVSAHVPQMHPQEVLESASYAPHKQGDQYARTGHNSFAEFAVNSLNSESSSHQLSTRNVNLVDKLSESQGYGPLHQNLSDVSSANFASMQKDLEVFGRSLKSNNLLHQNFSLLNQMRGMKAAEPDPNDRPFKRMKGPESGLEDQRVAPKSGQLSADNIDGGDTMAHHSLDPSGDLKMQSFSGAADNAERKASSQHSIIALPNFGRDDSRSNAHGNDPASVRVEPSLISPQMAPSWFNQYGTFRNGQSLAVHDARRGTFKEPAGKSSSDFHTLNSTEQVISADVGTGQVGNVQPSSTPLPGDHFSLVQSLPLKILKPKKRERATSGLIPWQKEVSQGSQDLQTVSMAELVWAKAANRLTERVGDEFFEDGPPLLRARRRLTLTTQLMQQLLQPPKLAVISSPEHSDCEGLAYSLSRSALGDACGIVSQSNCNSDMPHDGVNLLSDRCKKSERVDDQHLLKVIEDFISRARKLEIDFLRLDKRASVLDLRIESQELEKFSVINRFAKFHGRGQAESGVASSSADASANSLRSCLQRYVTALPIPRNLPDRVQCLSL